MRRYEKHRQNEEDSFESVEYEETDLFSDFCKIETAFNQIQNCLNC